MNMFNYIRSIITGLFILIATFVSPVKQITPTPPQKISATVTPKTILTITLTLVPTIATIQPQVQKCQFDREGFVKKAKELDYSDTEINEYLNAHPGNCINITENISVSQQVKDIEPTSTAIYHEQPTPYEPKNKSCYQSGDY